MGTALAGISVVAGTVALAVAGLLLAHRFLSLDARESSNPAVGAIYAALYVMFGISLGFSLYLVWQEFEATRQTVEREAGSVERIYRLAERFPETERESVQELAVLYARTVAEEEWPAMARGKVHPRAAQLADELGAAVRELDPQGDAESALYSESLARLDDLKESRELRLLEVREGLPALLWVVLIGGATLTVACTYLLGTRNLWLHALATGTLAAAIALLLFTIGVLDYPFNSDVRVGPEAFELVSEAIGG